MAALDKTALFSKAQELRDKIQFGSSGQCSKGIEKSIELQTNLKNEVDGLWSKFESDTKSWSGDDKLKYKDIIETLKSASAKKLDCLKTLKSVSSLELPCWNLSSLMDNMAVKLAANKKGEFCTAGVQLPGFIGQLSQNCIFGLTDEWNTISTLVRCLQIHLNNASEYHQFYHEIEESEKWMNSDLEDTVGNFESLPIDDPTDQTLAYFQSEFQTVHKVLSQWKCKLNRLLKISSTLVPVDLRTEENKLPIPAISLATFYHDNLKIREKEDILLLEGGSKEQWKISNGRGDEGYVPALFVLVPGPDQKAVQALDRLRFILLTYWTSVLKNYGARFIKLLLKVYKAQYDDNEAAILQGLEGWDRENILFMLKLVLDVFKNLWSQYDGYVTLEERFGVLKVLLEGDSDLLEQAGAVSNKKIDMLINGTPMFNDMANIYQELSKDWELYKTCVDVYKYPELMLLLEQWQQLHYIPVEKVARLWLKTLRIDGVKFSESDISIDGEKIDDDVKLDVVKATSSSRHDDDLDNLLLKFTTEAGAYEQIVKQVEVNPEVLVVHTKEQMATTTADAGKQIKKPKTQSKAEEGSTGEGFEEVKVVQTTTTTATTANQSSVDGDQHKVDFGGESTKQRADTEQITSASVEERQTFTIRSVVNPADGAEVSLDDAIYKGIIVPARGVYRDTKSGEDIPIQGAMAKGLIKVTVTSKKVEKEQKSSVGIITIKSLKETTRPFAIQSARDTTTGEDLNLKDATEKGVVDLGKGTFSDRAGKKTLSLNEAINRKLVAVEFLGEAKQPEHVVKRYAVRAVVDRKNKKTVTFDEAVRRGLIDKDGGFFYDNVTNEKIYVGDAVVKGFLKAKQVDEAEALSLNIDPINHILVDRTKIIRKKLLQPLAAVGAFKKLGGGGGGGGGK